MDFCRERSSFITIKLAILTISLPSTKTPPKPPALIRHFFFVKFPTRCSLFPQPLHLYDISYLHQVRELLLKVIHITNRLLVKDQVFTLQQVGDFERLLLTKAKPSSKFISMMVIGKQNLSQNLGEITHCFGSLGCWVTIYKQISIINGSRASFQL